MFQGNTDPRLYDRRRIKADGDKSPGKGILINMDGVEEWVDFTTAFAPYSITQTVQQLQSDINALQSQISSIPGMQTDISDLFIIVADLQTQINNIGSLSNPFVQSAVAAETIVAGQAVYKNSSNELLMWVKSSGVEPIGVAIENMLATETKNYAVNGYIFDFGTPLFTPSVVYYADDGSATDDPSMTLPIIQRLYVAISDEALQVKIENQIEVL